MSSFESIKKEMAGLHNQSGEENTKRSANPNPTWEVPPEVAHELNNALMIIQGYAERLLRKHGEDPATAAHIKVITEAAKRVANVIRNSKPANAGAKLEPGQKSAPPPTSAA
jgi:nitrogen-specific signal transduction histidine kinase